MIKNNLAVLLSIVVIGTPFLSLAQVPTGKLVVVCREPGVKKIMELVDTVRTDKSVTSGFIKTSANSIFSSSGKCLITPELLYPKSTPAVPVVEHDRIATCKKLYANASMKCTEYMCAEQLEDSEDSECVVDGDFNVGLSECVSEELPSFIEKFNKANFESKLNCDDIEY